MEYFDITDDNGIPTGETVSRTKAHEEGIPHRTAHVWIVEKKGESYRVLLQKRSMEKESFPGMYDTSSAGHIQAGDEPLESAQRELQEELGISAGEEDLSFAGKFHIEYAMEFHGKMFRDNEIAFVYVYEKPVDIAGLELQKEEVDEVKWFDIEEVHEGCVHRDGTFCVPMEGLETLMKYLEKKADLSRDKENITKATSRISEMEAILDEALRRMDNAKESMEALLEYQPKIKELEEYYYSQNWKEDLSLDEKGLLPKNLKRGVLSEDGIYNALERNKELLEEE